MRKVQVLAPFVNRVTFVQSEVWRQLFVQKVVTVVLGNQLVLYVRVGLIALRGHNKQHCVRMAITVMQVKLFAPSVQKGMLVLQALFNQAYV